MSIAPSSVRLFGLAVHLWLVVYLLTRLSAFEFLWAYPVSPVLPAHGLLSWTLDPLAHLPEGAVYVAFPLALVLAVRGLFLPHRWYFAAVLWVLYVGLMQRAWLAGSAGQQFMGIVLFWSVFIGRDAAGAEPTPRHVLATFGVWALRLQLLLVYAAAAAHKLTGTTWLDGTAVGIVATDGTYDLGWLMAVPGASVLLTWLVLSGMLLFPLAVWWRPTRRIFLVMGALFHLATAVFLGIPEMGTAFLVAYALWLDEDEARHFLAPFGRLAALR